MVSTGCHFRDYYSRVSRNAAFLIPFLVLVSSCQRESSAPPPGAPAKPPTAAVSSNGGDAAAGKQKLTQYDCESCHIIPGLGGAQGTAGPSLAGIGSRKMIVAKFPNTPENLSRWIQHPQSLDPQTSMPDLGVTASDARDITAFLQTER